jgi:fluoroquinolone resistance protein
VGRRAAVEYDKDNLPYLDEYSEGDSFDGIDFSHADLRERSFQDCAFVSCVFEKSDLFGSSFRDCSFRKCQLTLPGLKNTAFSDVEFNECKLIGLNFSECNRISFSVSFVGSILDSVVIFEKGMNKTRFIDDRIRNCAFDHCEMKGCDFGGSAFEATTFHACNLEKSDFSKAKGYLIDPSTNKLRNAAFSLPEACSFLSFLGITIID